MVCHVNTWLFQNLFQKRKAIATIAEEWNVKEPYSNVSLSFAADHICVSCHSEQCARICPLSRWNPKWQQCSASMQSWTVVASSWTHESGRKSIQEPIWNRLQKVWFSKYSSTQSYSAQKASVKLNYINIHDRDVVSPGAGLRKKWSSQLIKICLWKGGFEKATHFRNTLPHNFAFSKVSLKR